MSVCVCESVCVCVLGEDSDEVDGIAVLQDLICSWLWPW